ncbi:DNA polymerase beta superfamily protein, partial [Streptomyces rubiginosohelvolus]
HHYRGFANTQWRLFERTGELKPLLYTFRALLTGIHLMRSGEVLAHLPALLARVEAPGYLPGLIEAKAEAEHGGADAVDAAAVGRDVEVLHGVLDAAQEASELPDGAGGFDALHGLVVRTRLSGR